MQARRKHQFAGGRSFGSDASSVLLQTILRQARKSGQLNLSNRSFTEVPSAVWRINIDTPEEGKTISMDDADDRWWEQIDLTKLILASNALDHLAEDIKLLPALVVLDLHDNKLTSLPEAIGDLKNLQRLNVGHNLLESVPLSVFRLNRLQTLHIENNGLAVLHNDIGYLDELEDLNLSGNSLTSLPMTVGHLTRLTKLNLSNNCLQTLPREIGLLRSLRTLELTHNQIHTLPDDIGDLRHLECLYMRHNKITNLPTLDNCTSLKEIHVGNNNVSSIAADTLTSLVALSVLDVRDNKLDKLPDEIGLCQTLERLDLANNSLSTVPNTLGTLPNLKAIVLDGNPLKSIRRDIIMRGTNELKKYLRSRIEPAEEQASRPTSASVLQSTRGTSGIIGGTGEGVDRYRIASTKTLEYCDKKATEIPSELITVSAESQVMVVNLSRNCLTALPPRLAELHQSASELYLSFNKLSALDPCIGRLDRLIMLDLSNNQLKDLPDELASLHLLREIAISYNRFTYLPSVIYHLKRLEIVMANDNQISDFDAHGLCEMPMIATLALQNNNILTLPPQLGNCTQLRTLQLEGNSFKLPRAAILAKGTVAVLEYLRGRIPAS